MKKPFLPFATLLLFGGVAFACPAWAQQNPATPSGVTLQRPTDDGYEDLLNAVYAIPYRSVNSPPDDATAFRDLLKRAAHGDLPLADKRAILRDERVRDALGYLRDALDKPHLTRVRSSSEQDALDHREINIRTLGSLRCVLSVKIYVELADGATASAIGTFAESLDLADALGCWDLDGASDGSEMMPYTVNPLFLHLDRLSEDDCRRLASLLKRELDTSNPGVAGLRAEEKVAVERVDKYLQAERLIFLSPTDEAAVVKLRAAGGADWADFVAAAKAAVAKDCREVADIFAEYPQSLEAARIAPSAEQAERSERDALVDKVLRASSAVSLVRRDSRWSAILLNELAERDALLRLLAVHAAIHQYKWDHNVLPASLDALKIVTLANDPYVGGSMHYEQAKDGKSYELSCAGPPNQHDEKGQPMMNGKRTPVTLPYTGFWAP